MHHALKRFDKHRHFSAGIAQHQRSVVARRDPAGVGGDSRKRTHDGTCDEEGKNGENQRDAACQPHGCRAGAVQFVTEGGVGRFEMGVLALDDAVEGAA